MLQNIKTLFKDLISEESHMSMTRFLTLLITGVALFIAIYSVLRDKDNTELVALLLGSGLSAKVAQRFAEERSSKQSPAPQDPQDK